MANLLNLISTCFGVPEEVKGKKRLPPAIPFQAGSSNDIPYQPRLAPSMYYLGVPPGLQATVEISQDELSMEGTEARHSGLATSAPARACQEADGIIHIPLDPSIFAISSPGDISPISLGPSPTLTTPTLMFSQEPGTPTAQGVPVTKPDDISANVGITKKVMMKPVRPGKPNLILQIPATQSKQPAEVPWPSPASSTGQGENRSAVLAQELDALGVTSLDFNEPSAASAGQASPLPPSQMHTISIHDWAHEQHRNSVEPVSIPLPSEGSDGSGASPEEAEEGPKPSNITD
ncbi:MAG: hypothetical protein Q9222_006570 [Ikaeria aurantiellina]